jgi:hypothetical protein
MDAVDRLDWLTRAYRVGQVIRTAALFGVCDVLADEPMSAEQVAVKVGAATDPLRRLLRALVAIDVLSESNGVFSTAEMGELLRRGHPDAMRDVAIGRMRDTWWRAWGALPDAVRTGQSGYLHANGRTMWEDLAGDPEAAATFNAMMGSGTEEYVHSLVEAVDLSAVRHLVDLGGGQGTLLAALLAVVPAANGTLFDRPAGLVGAADYLGSTGIGERVELMPGDFFQSVPPGGDVYILRRILHDWADEDAVAILKTCRQAIDDHGRLLIVDMIMPERPVAGPAEEEEVFTLDLHMLVLLGARERSVSEFNELLQPAGFRISEVVETAPERTIVCAPV